MKLTESQVKFYLSGHPEVKTLIDVGMPNGFDALLIFKPGENGKLKPYVSFRAKERP